MKKRISIMILIIIMVIQVKCYAEVEIISKEEASEKINNIVEAFCEDGLTKENLQEAISEYKELSKDYSNDEISKMLNDSKEILEEKNIKADEVESVTKVLNNFEAKQLSNVLESVNVEETLENIQSGDTVADIIQTATQNMSAKDKVGLIVSIVKSAKITRIVLYVLSALIIYKVLLRVVIYKKAGKNPIAAFIPIYSQITMLKLCEMSPWWMLFILLPVIGWIALWLVYVASKFIFAEKFGKGVLFSFGLWLLAPIFETYIVLSKKTKYIK